MTGSSARCERGWLDILIETKAKRCNELESKSDARMLQSSVDPVKSSQCRRGWKERKEQRNGKRLSSCAEHPRISFGKKTKEANLDHELQGTLTALEGSHVDRQSPIQDRARAGTGPRERTAALHCSRGRDTDGLDDSGRQASRRDYRATKGFKKGFRGFA